jgi:hypothetical protein
MVLGVYYLTMKQKANHKGDGRAFSNFDEVEMAYALDQVEVHSEVKISARTWYDDKGDRLPEAVTRVIDTTVGRCSSTAFCHLKFSMSTKNWIKAV